MSNRFSIVIDPSNASPLYIGGDAEKAKSIIKSRKADGEAVAGWINIRPEKRFLPPAVNIQPAIQESDNEPDVIDELVVISNDEIEELVSLAQGDGRKKDVQDARSKLDDLGIEY
jgi:hypothetical protein